MKSYKFRGFARLAGSAAAVALCVFTLFSGISHAGVSGTPHDLSIEGETWNFLTRQKCVFCHTPHGANTKVRTLAFWNSTGYQNTDDGVGDAIYLWNRDMANSPAYNPSTAYRLYESTSTLNATVEEVRVYSLMCLSCHDGVGALNVLYNYPNEPAAAFRADGSLKRVGETGTPLDDQIGDSALESDRRGNIGGRTTGEGSMPADDMEVDLRNDHPISFDYTDSLAGADGGLQTRASIPAAFRFFPNPSGNSDSLECSTCHDPHNYGSDVDRTQPFLVMTVRDSALCTACHLK